MSGRTFLPWVDPVAKQLREGRIEVVRTAQQLLPEHWSQPSPLKGWTYKDLLAHLASGDWVFQWMLRGALGRETFDLIERGFDYVNQGNKERILARRTRSPEQLIEEVASDGETTQALLAELTADVDPKQVMGRRADGTDVTLEMWVTNFPMHDTTHGAQLKTALAQVMM